MKAERTGSWRKVADGCRTTVGMDKGTKEPSDRWKKRLLLAEHSPIRKLWFNWKWEGLKYWVSVHFVRHKHGVEHMVRTQRTDRSNGVDRDKLPQDAPVNHEVDANAQALIAMGRKRLCCEASLETRIAMHEVKRAVKKVDPILSAVIVPECIYRGFCPEGVSGCISDSPKFADMLKEYREVK